MEKATKKEILSLVLAIMLLVLSACSAVNCAEEAEGTAAATTEAAIETTEETTEETAAETTEAMTEATTEATEPTATEAIEAQEVDAEITEATEPEPNAAIVNVNSYVNVRAEKSVSSEKVGTYAKGERIYIETVETSGGVRWGKTELGWVCMDYVQLDGEPAPANMDSADSVSAETEATDAAAFPAEQEPDASAAAEEAQATETVITIVIETQPADEALSDDPAQTQQETDAAEAEEPSATQCQHVWNTTVYGEIGHWTESLKCACGETFSTTAAWIAHVESYEALDALLYHGGYNNSGEGGEYIVDSPARTVLECAICGETEVIYN